MAEKKRFDVWIQEYKEFPGGHGPARLLGSADAPTFLEACKLVISQEGMEEHYDEESNTWWLLGLYETYEEALL